MLFSFEFNITYDRYDNTDITCYNMISHFCSIVGVMFSFETQVVGMIRFQFESLNSEQIDCGCFCLTRCRISMCQGLGPKNTMKFRKSTVVTSVHECLHVSDKAWFEAIPPRAASLALSVGCLSKVMSATLFARR